MKRSRVCGIVGLMGLMGLMGVMGVAHAQTGRIEFRGAVVTPTEVWSVDRAVSPTDAPVQVAQTPVSLQDSAPRPDLLTYALQRDLGVRWTLVTLTYG